MVAVTIEDISQGKSYASFCLIELISLLYCCLLISLGHEILIDYGTKFWHAYSLALERKRDLNELYRKHAGILPLLTLQE